MKTIVYRSGGMGREVRQPEYQELQPKYRGSDIKYVDVLKSLSARSWDDTGLNFDYPDITRVAYEVYRVVHQVWVPLSYDEGYYHCLINYIELPRGVDLKGVFGEDVIASDSTWDQRYDRNRVYKTVEIADTSMEELLKRMGVTK